MAHPGDGIDVDSQRTIYFTDVKRQTLWKLSPEGDLTAALTGRWSHGLCVDAKNRVWLEVEVNNTQFAIVRLETDGSETTIIGPTERGLDVYGVNILADAEDNLYFPHSDPPRFFARGLRHRAPDGAVRLIAGNERVGHRDGLGSHASFTAVQSICWGPDQDVYLVDRDTIRRVSLDGAVETLYRDVRDATPERQPFDNGNPEVSNRLYGLDVEPNTGAVVVAYHGNRAVLRLSPSGKETLYQADKPWSPVGVVFDGDRLLIKESGLEPGSPVDGPRIRALDADGVASTLITVQ